MLPKTLTAPLMPGTSPLEDNGDGGRVERTGAWILFATVLASSMAFIDSTALNVALPALQASLGATGTELLWILNIYALFVAALLLVAGSLGDRFGCRRVYMLGIVLFCVA